MLKNQKGSLLMDILVTLGIIVLMSSISLPFFKKYQPNLKLNGAARDITSDLRYAQQMTITEQIPYALQFDVINDSYEIKKDGASPLTVKTTVLPDEINIQQITGFTGNKIVFNSYGAVSEEGTIILENINNKTATINIKPSGYVQLKQ